MKLNREDILKKLKYDPETGVFIWIRTNKIAGHMRKDGYCIINFNGKLEYAHALAITIYQSIPDNCEVDHIDGNPSNNCLNNLRICTSQQNKFNTKRPVTNSSGVKGVHFDNGTQKFRVRMRVDGKFVHFGLFDNLRDAEVVAKATRALHHKEFSNHG